ncbi:MAG: metallophosphoesterase [Liquorilactobacillus ghanensis]|uniref:metallophosphoesterase family protein n=1 Tax=Liquorilactobacillus ghanensis TaxID=399370 RepID=UPI0039EB3141
MNKLKPEPGTSIGRQSYLQKQFNINVIDAELNRLSKQYDLNKSDLENLANGLISKYNSVITASTQDGEVKDARVDLGGTTHDSLNERLTTDLETLANTLASNYADVKADYNSKSSDIQGAFPAYYDDDMDAVTQLSTGTNAVNIACITDNHWQMAVQGQHSLRHYSYIARASRLAKLDAIVANGDNVNGYYNRDEVFTENRQALQTIFNLASVDTPVLINRGNHDSGRGQDSAGGTGLDANNSLTDAEMKQLYRTADCAYGEVRDGDSLYWFKDLDDKKVRIIGLDSFDLPETLDSNGNYKYDTLNTSAYRQDQLNWLANTALKTNYQVVIFTHCPLPNTFQYILNGNAGTTQYNSDVLIKILQAFCSGTSYSIDDESREFSVTLSADFSSQGQGTLIGMISGHVHRDGEEIIYGGLHLWEQTCSLCNAGDPYSRADDTVTEDAWDIISIDTNAKTIHCHRFGAGKDRAFKYFAGLGSTDTVLTAGSVTN